MQRYHPAELQTNSAPSAVEPHHVALPARTIPLWLKCLYTLFLTILVPIYWAYGNPLNFLWFCDVAMVITLVALWLENRLLAGMAALAVVWPQLLWVLDFVGHLLFGIRIFGFSDYMFDPKVLVLARCLSLFHIWLPILLVWLVWRLGYDRRALAAQTFCAWLVLALSYILTRDIHGPAGNLNMVYGLSNREPQAWMPSWLWLGVVMLAVPVCIYGPVHFVFRRVFPQPSRLTVSG